MFEWIKAQLWVENMYTSNYSEKEYIMFIVLCTKIRINCTNQLWSLNLVLQNVIKNYIYNLYFAKWQLRHFSRFWEVAWMVVWFFWDLEVQNLCLSRILWRSLMLVQLKILWAGLSKLWTGHLQIRTPVQKLVETVTIMKDTKYIHIYIEYLSVCPLVGIGTSPTPLSPASVPLPPEPKGGTLASGWGAEGVPIPTTGEKA